MPHGSQQEMGSRGQFARSSVAHHHLGITPTFREMAQKAKRSPSAATPSKAHSPPPSRPTKVEPGAPKSKVSSIQAVISALGGRPRSCSVGQSEKALQRAKERSSPSTNAQAEPGKSMHAWQKHKPESLVSRRRWICWEPTTQTQNF